MTPPDGLIGQADFRINSKYRIVPSHHHQFTCQRNYLVIGENNQTSLFLGRNRCFCGRSFRFHGGIPGLGSLLTHSLWLEQQFLLALAIFHWLPFYCLLSISKRDLHPLLYLLERVDELARCGEAVLGHFRHRFLHEKVYFMWKLGANTAKRGHLIVHMFDDDINGGIALERRVAGQHLEENGGER